MGQKNRFWTKKKIDQFIIPIHINKIHWFLIVIRNSTKEIWLIDSLPNEHASSYFNNVMRFWSDYMQSQGEDYINCSEWKFIDKNCTRQEDSDSCGIFMCSNMLLLCNASTTFNYPDHWAERFRQYMVYCFHLPYLFTMEDVCQMCGRWCVDSYCICNEVE